MLAGSWLKQLRFGPVHPLFRSNNQAIHYFVTRDLVGHGKGRPLEKLWKLQEVEKILRRQLGNGAWKYHGGHERIRSSEDYNQLQTYRISGQLVEKYGLNKKHPAIERAGGYLLFHQTKEGNFRGIYGNHYSPNYSAAIVELLIKAGYCNDSRIRNGFSWLLSIRQLAGSWAIPLRRLAKNLDSEILQGKLIHPNTTKPFSHLVTGVVLRAPADSN